MMALDARILLGFQNYIEPYGNALARAMQIKAQQQGMQMNALQMQQAQQQMAEKERQARQQAEAQQLQGNELARLQGGGQLDPIALFRAGVPKEQIEFLANRGNLGRQEVAREAERRGPDGKPEKVFFDKFGNSVGAALPQAVKMETLDLGGARQVVDPYALAPGQEFKRTQTPDSVASNAITMRGQNMVDARAREANARASEGGKPPAGYRWKADGSLEAIPGGPADQKLGGPGARIQDARDVLDMLNIAEPLIDKSTSSYAGAGIDQAARAVGVSTQGAQAAAELKALEGALISKMPKMSGPQSDKDVMLYRQMAGQIGDSTIPAETKKAAVRTIRALNERYAGQAPASPTAPAVKPSVSNW